MSVLDASIEKIPFLVFEDKDEASVHVAQQIASLIAKNNKQGEKTVLGLVAGKSPVLIYRELVKIHRLEGLSFENVIIFLSNEYYPISNDNKCSFYAVMYEHILRHVDIKPENIHFPDGSLSSVEIDNFCSSFENKISAYGGIDFLLLGIGLYGQIGFNEPGAAFNSMTRLVKLKDVTIEEAIADFGSEEAVPPNGLTIGIKTIMNAKRIVLVAWGGEKASVLKKVIEGEIDSNIPASFLQQHSNVQFVIDAQAAFQLSRNKTPWLTGSCDWNLYMKKKAVVWLCEQTQKPILKLTETDYKQNGLADLIKAQGSAYNLNIEIYNQIQQTITGWPGGKPNSDDRLRPERSEPYPKRVIIFSPHPDDDVISMGGTLLRLVEQGHEVHVAYQTSGNIAVSDEEAHRFADFALAFSKKFDLNQEQVLQLHQQVIDQLDNKTATTNSKEVLHIKGLIRQGEATAACRFCGVEEKNIHFLDMPFYETGDVEKNELGTEDIQLIADLLSRVKPHQIFAAGDLQDPHGTHAVCLHAIMKAIDGLKKESWMNDCYVWLYRGAWQEWEIEDIDMAVPISPEELLKKRNAIFKHQSQKDSPVFPGKDKREFWQRAEDRNRATARIYDEMGLTEYEAIEAFKRYYFSTK